MAEKKTPDGGLKGRVRFERGEPDEGRPEIVIALVDRDLRPLHVAEVDPEGHFQLPEPALEDAHLVMIGPRSEDGRGADVEASVRLRPAQLRELVQKTGFVGIADRFWKAWVVPFTCVTGTVRRCRPSWVWYAERIRQFDAAEFLGTAIPKPFRTVRTQSASIRRIAEALTPVDLVGVHPQRCYVVCDGRIEVYRRICCCPREWVIDDPRLPHLIDDLEHIVERQPPEIHFPPRPEPDPFFQMRLADLPFLTHGALDERTLNARRDLAALRSLSGAEAASYVWARPYLWWCLCGDLRRVAIGEINPDGTFNICWRQFTRILPRHCHYQYAYKVRQLINGVWTKIYDGVAANIWFGEDDDAELVSYDRRARVCRDNGARDDAYVYLELIGGTEAWHLKTPDATGWNRVAAPASNDGLVFPVGDPSPGGPTDAPWGGTLALYFKFSEGLRDVGARYYRVSVTEADVAGNPVGTRWYWGNGLSWEKSIGFGVTVPVTLGPNTVGTESHLYQIPYDADADWDAGQFHVHLDTNDSNWSDPEKRHLLTLEIFDGTGRRMRPNGTPATGQPGTEIEAPFTYRRQFQDLGPTTAVPFGALTHLFWWDNRRMEADLLSLIKSGLQFDAECQYLEGTAGSTFAVLFRAYHHNPLFHAGHTIKWYRGAGTTAEHEEFFHSSASNEGQPPNPPAASTSVTFADMLRTSLDPTRLKCSFVVTLHASAKTFNGWGRLAYLDWGDQWAFSIEINA
jgi:hypothetical protein